MPEEIGAACPNCGTTAETGTSHCSQCGASFSQTPRVAFAAGCASFVGGALLGCVGALAVLAFIVGVLGNSSQGNATFSAVLIVIDLLAIALAARTIWSARRGSTAGSLFLIGLTLGLAGLLSTCSLMLFSLGNFNVH